MRELITILDAALAANLGKRQWAVFAAVLRQTLGYRKTADDLSSGRLSGLTGIQRNHVWQAKQELVDSGLLLSAPGKYGEVLGFAVLHEKLPPVAAALSPSATDSGYALSGVAATLPATNSGCMPPPIATKPGYAAHLPATGSGEVSPDAVTVSVSATDTGYPAAAMPQVLHEKLAGVSPLVQPSPTPPIAPAMPVTPDLGAGLSQFGRKTVPKQDTSLSNHTQSNHDNSTSPLPSPPGSPSAAGLGTGGVPAVGLKAGLSATDSGLHLPSVFERRLSATDSGYPLAGELDWPAGLDAPLRQGMAGLLCGLAVETAQSVLDVLAMGLEAGKVRKPLAYLRVLVQAAHNGGLVTAEAQAWREKRSQGRAAQVSPEVLERAGELAWLRQVASLQGLPVETVAVQLGVKVRLPCQRMVEEVSTVAAGDVPATQWKRGWHGEPPLGGGGIRSVSA